MEVDDLYDVIVEGWERQESENGVPYFVCHQTQTTSWDHPYFMKILEELDDYHDIRYAAYRTAIKVRHLQKRLSLHQITLKVIRSVLDNLGYPDGCETKMNCRELSTLLLGIYHTADHRQAPRQSPQVFADLMLNFLLNLYDVNRSGSVSILSVKIALATLCSARLVEKYRFFYNEVKDQSTYVGENGLISFIQDIMQIPDLLKESVAFGRNVSAVVASCIQGMSSARGVSEDVFYSWLLREPQTLVWLPTLHRLAAAETVKHEAKCNVCKAFPIIGFRYRCLKCFNFDICQHCFFTGQTRKNHKLKHPLQEYCLMTTSKDDTKAFMKTIRNNLSKKHRQNSKVKYLPIDSARLNPMMEWSGRPGPNEPSLGKVLNNEIEGPRSHDNLPIARQPLGESNTFRPNTNTVVVLNNSPRKTPAQSRQDKENVTDARNFTKFQPQEYEGVIHRLQEENRNLHRKIAELRQMSDTESNLSYEADLEMENDVILAQNDVLEDHNRRLSRQLNRVQNVLKKQPANQPSHAGANQRPVSMSNLGNSLFSPLSIDTSPQACSSRIPSKNPTPANPGSYYTEPRRRKDMTNTPTGRDWHSSTTPGSPQWTAPTTPVTPENERLPGYPPKTPEWAGPEAESYFTPGVSKSQFCPEEEAEIQELLKRIDDALPANLSYSGYSVEDCKSYNNNEEMLQAANNIGTAMSNFVHTTVDPYGPQ